jgi:DNA invertase Pin-like site-specific DNA recombinase
MLVGYIRTSTVEQEAGFEAQRRELQALGCEQIFEEKVSSIAARPQLGNALDFLRVGDVLIVTKLDRLARSVRDLVTIIDRIEAKGATLRVLAMNLDTSTSTGKLMLNVLGSVAQFEREVMLERQREGIAKAKAEKKYKGRAPTARAKAAEVRQLAATGMSKARIATELGISPRSVFRVLAEAPVRQRQTVIG